MMRDVPLRLQVTASDDPAAKVYRYEFDGDRAQILLGRRGGVDVLLPHDEVALVHARIERRGGSYFLVDEGSSGGTTVNGARVEGGARTLLRDRDRIGIGAFRLEVSVLLTELDGPGAGSRLVVKRMVRDVLERLGPGGSQPHLVVAEGPQAGALLSLDDAGRTYILGRDAAGRVGLDDVDMWRDHAALERDDGGVTVRAVGGPRTLSVNGEPLSSGRLLRDGDRLALGELALRFVDPAEVYLRQLQKEAPPPPASAPDSPIQARRRPQARIEWGLFALGAAAVVVAVAGLVYVLLW
jgi:pSer/pThr/pTyr-binding forkhead associated (FHA) protein